MTFTKRIAVVMAALAVVAVSALGTPAMADNHPMKPYILISNGAGDAGATVKDVSNKLKAGGFEIAGTYRIEGKSSLYTSATILVVTNDTLKAAAAKSADAFKSKGNDDDQFGAYGVAQRVAITDVGGKVQVSHTNPEYMAASYRMAGNLSDVKKQLASALGAGKEYGMKEGIVSSKLRRYHYMPFMEYFDEPSELRTWGSYDEAVAGVEASLANNKFGIGKVARIDVPGKQETYFAVSMTGEKDLGDIYSDDAWMMSIIDFADVRSAAHLPYEIVVSGKTAYALYARFRIAQSFPDLSMMGHNSFITIVSSPEAMRKAMINAMGGKIKSSIRGID